MGKDRSPWSYRAMARVKNRIDLTASPARHFSPASSSSTPAVKGKKDTKKSSDLQYLLGAKGLAVIESYRLETHLLSLVAGAIARFTFLCQSTGEEQGRMDGQTKTDRLLWFLAKLRLLKERLWLRHYEQGFDRL